MAETMTGRDYYIQNGYDELPEEVRIEMRRMFDTGVNNSGVWVRYKEVENLAGVMAYQYTHRSIAANGWIPADKPPTKDGEYLTLMKGYVRQYRDILRYDAQNADWYRYDPDYGDEQERLHYDNVLMWCEMPEVPE